MARKIALSPGGRRAGQRVSLAPKTWQQSLAE
jgi:hypothetical protein